jgi:hypothetical protein
MLHELDLIKLILPSEKQLCYYVNTTANRVCTQLQPFKLRIKSHLTFASVIRRSNIYGYVHRGYIPIYIQQDATLHSLFIYPETALHVLDDTSTHHQESIQLYLQHLVFVTPFLLSAAIVEELELV